MVEPGRTFTASTASSYRYGFNGQEKSTEVNSDGNLYNGEFWEYDSRIVRRWNVDPVPKVYESPYAVLGNNPISNIDPDGSDTLTFTMNTTNRKERRMKSGLDGTSSKVVMPGSSTTTENIDIKKGEGADVFYYQQNTTTIDENGKLQEFNPAGSASNFYRTGGWSGILGPQYDDRNVLAMLAPKSLLQLYANKSNFGPQKWAYQTAIVNKSDIPFIAGLQKGVNISYTIAGAYGVFRFAASNLVAETFESQLAQRGAIGTTIHFTDQMAARGFTKDAILKIMDKGVVQEQVYKGQCQIIYKLGDYKVLMDANIGTRNYGKLINVMGDWNTVGANGVRGAFTGF